jgi:hypothetical protein
MSTSLVNDVNDVMEEYEDQFNIEWGEWGEEKSLYCANVQSEGGKGACTFPFHKLLAKIVGKTS